VSLREQVRATLRGNHKPRVPVVLERVGLIRKLEDSWTFQIRERLDTGTTRTYPPIEVYSPITLAMEHDVELVTDEPGEVYPCPVLNRPITREEIDSTVYYAVDSPTRDIPRSNKFAASRFSPGRAAVEYAV
jgi:hypothetical protein